MKIKDDLVGRDVLDETGHKIGEVDDLDVDFDSMKIDSIILHEGGHIIGGKERV
ncbi:MAG: PRC-barrel domain-containing protein, partial [Methanobacterium sp.]